MRPRPDTRGASFGDRYTIVLVTACPWVWSTFLRRCVQAGAEVMVYTCPISARIPLGPANLVTVSVIRAELGCRTELARRIVCDLRPRGPARDRYLWAEVLAHPLVSDGEDDGDAPTLSPTWRAGRRSRA